MHENKNNARVCGRLLSVALKVCLLTGVLVTAHAQDVPAETQPPQVPAAGAVDLEVFEGVHILRTPGTNSYPVGEVRDGKEGWVVLDMMIDPKGTPYEVMVLDSSGNPAFEKAALKALKQMSFEPARHGKTPIDSSFIMKMKFAIASLAKGASRDFVTAYRRFVTAIEAGDKVMADQQREKLKPQNLYEDAFANFGTYYYHAKWGTPAEQLTDLRSAIAGEKHPEYLPRAAFRTALAAMFALEVKAGDYGSALDTWEILEPIATEQLRADFRGAVDQMRTLQAGNQQVVTSQTIDQRNYWSGKLFRNRFGIDVTSGALSEIKLRCQKQYLFFAYKPNVQYSIGTKKDQCGIEVVGDPGTTFNLIQ